MSNSKIPLFRETNKFLSLYYHNMIEKVRTYIEKHQLLDKGKPVIVGLSGGADSVALLSILVQLGYDCRAAHCNFHLRGDESDRDEEFSRLYAKSLSVPFTSVDFDTRHYAADNQISIEMAARELRYQWFDEQMSKQSAQAIAVAHHQDDQVETLLLNLVRGTGLRGMRGMYPRNGAIIRPLLLVSKNELIAWLEDNKINYVTDSTNNSTDYKRNYIRHEIIPALEKLNPSLKETISRSAAYFAEAENLYDYVLEQARFEIVPRNGIISIPALMKYPSPETILYEYLKPYHYNRFVVQDIFDSLGKESGKIFHSSTHSIVKDRDSLIIQPIQKEPSNIYTIEAGQEQVNTPVKLSFQKIVLNEEFVLCKDKNIAYFDYDKLLFPLTIRKWQTGDWFIPFGMKGRKKLSDYFSNHKYSLPDKEKQWLLCSGKDIIWVIGERSDNRYRVDQNTRIVLIVKFYV